LPQAAPPVQSRYTITDLGTLGGIYSNAIGINDAGQVVGESYLPGNNGHAFLWDDGTMTDLGTLGGRTSGAFAINESGQIVGTAITSSGVNHAFLWQNGVMQDLGTLGWYYSEAYGINDAGQIVGVSHVSSSVVHAFLWQNGAMQDLGTLGGSYSMARAINESGQIVGTAFTNNDEQHAFLWQNGVMQDLGALGGYPSNAYGINDAGQVVGGGHTGGNGSYAFLWQNGAMQDLGTLGGIFSQAFAINDAGQVVGHSRNATGERHAFLWENGQMKDLNTLIPADSGWELIVANGINKRGQIVGMGLTNEEAHAFLLTPRLPVLIVPGIAGTYASSTIPDSAWLKHRGVHPSELQIDPLGHVYNDLIQTLKNVGYEEGKDLFVVNYDWRLMPGPIDGTFDGHVSGLNAQSLADEQFTYAVDYLGYYLRKASEAYRAEHDEDLPAVNIISHSTGGLVARTYIQSDAYGGEYDPVNHYKLPKIDQFIMVGVPNRGASKAWNPLHDNWVADVAYRAVLSKIVNRAYQKVTAVFGSTITGPDYNIDKNTIKVNGVVSPTLMIKQYVPTIRSLLATYDFLDTGSGFTNVNNDPTIRNDTILDLNNGLDLMPTADPNPFADLTNTTVICGGLGYTANLVVERTGTAAENVLLPFTDFFANDADANDEWYEDLWMANGGDGTVPLESCYEQFIGDGRVKTKLIYGVGINHTSLMSDASVQSFMLDTLKIKYQPQNISTGSGLSFANVLSVISDPVETILVDGQGRRLGYSQATGVLTEIPGSSWFGTADGFGFISEPTIQPLHLELTGLGEDHYVMVSVERAGRPAGGVISAGHLAQGETVTVPIQVNSLLFLPFIRR